MLLKYSKYITVLVLLLNTAHEISAKKNEEETDSMKNHMMKEDMLEENSNTTMGDMDDTIDLDTDNVTEPLTDDTNATAPEVEKSKKSVKNFTCQVTGALLSMANSIKELNNDIKAIKDQMFEKCPGFQINRTDDEVDQMEDSMKGMNMTDDVTELEEDSDAEETTKLPPIPTECDEPFELVANSCYYFLYYPPDWKTWGDANAYCQSLGGTLAAPYRTEDLRTYLVENFSNVFWVGAKKSTTNPGTFEWLNGRQLADEDWKEGQPSKPAAKFCVYLEYFSGYKAISHYCGEKFSFICEKRVDAEDDEEEEE